MRSIQLDDTAAEPSRQCLDDTIHGSFGSIAPERSTDERQSRSAGGARITKAPYLALIFDLELDTLRDLYELMSDPFPSTAQSRSLAVHGCDSGVRFRHRLP